MGVGASLIWPYGLLMVWPLGPAYGMLVVDPEVQRLLPYHRQAIRPYK